MKKILIRISEFECLLEQTDRCEYELSYGQIRK